MVQRYIVLLEDRVRGQIFLGYDNIGRINANYLQAFRYDTELSARIALRKVRRDRAWCDARILGCLVKVPE
jgi:hypothetical protein